METYLARELRKYYQKKYYQKKGTKYEIIFRNGMNLSALAMNMGEEHWRRYKVWAAWTSVLSKVVNGERLFTFVQLEVFCEILDLNETEQKELRNALHEDHRLKHEVKLKKRISRQVS